MGDKLAIGVDFIGTERDGCVFRSLGALQLHGLRHNSPRAGTLSGG